MNHRVLRRVAFALSVAVIVTGLAAVGLGAGAFGGFQRRASDTLFPSAKTDPRVVVVGIDQKSEVALGPYSTWPRSYQAQLATQLARAGAGAVAWDIVFAGSKVDDATFAAALRGLPAAVLAETGRLGPGSDPTLDKLTDPAHPTSTLAAAASALGHAEILPDPADGVVRVLPLVVETPGGALTPSLSLAALRSLAGDQGPLTVRPDGVQAAGRFIPTEGRHVLRLNWADGLRGTAGQPSLVSAVDVITGRVPRSRLAGKVVFIGAVDPLLGDHQLVPINKSTGIPGVFIHANAVNTMLTASYLSPVSNLETDFWVAVLALGAEFAVSILAGWLAATITPLAAG